MTEQKESNENHDSDAENVEKENSKNNENQGFVAKIQNYTRCIAIDSMVGTKYRNFWFETEKMNNENTVNIKMLAGVWFVCRRRCRWMIGLFAVFAAVKWN